MTKRETAEKYLRDGGCESKCIGCAFETRCNREYGVYSGSEYGLELAKAYLEKQENKMKNDDGWIDFDDPKNITEARKIIYRISDYPGISDEMRNNAADLACYLGKVIEKRKIQKAQVSHEEIKISVDKSNKRDYSVEIKYRVKDGELYILETKTIPPEEV